MCGEYNKRIIVFTLLFWNVSPPRPPAPPPLPSRSPQSFSRKYPVADGLDSHYVVLQVYAVPFFVQTPPHPPPRVVSGVATCACVHAQIPQAGRRSKGYSHAGVLRGVGVGRRLPAPPPGLRAPPPPPLPTATPALETLLRDGMFYFKATMIELLYFIGIDSSGMAHRPENVSRLGGVSQTLYSSPSSTLVS